MGDNITTQIIQCNQRKKFQNLIIPSSRFEMLNPYIGSQYTNTDFDMRRKAEILKYSNNNKLRKFIAKNGRNKYFKYFNSTIIAEYILNKTFNIKTKKYFWENR